MIDTLYKSTMPYGCCTFFPFLGHCFSVYALYSANPKPYHKKEL